MIRSFLFFSASVIYASHAFAAANNPIPNIIITANRIEQTKDKVGSSVTVISREEIEASGASQVYDLIKRVPGVTVTRNGGEGADSSVWIRGSTPGQVRIMIDGVYMNDPSDAGREYNFNSLLINDIERIEVLRGAQSALYGSDAMGGVINIITKKGSGALKFNAFSEAGSYNTFREALGVSGAQGKADYTLQLQHYKTDGFSRVANTAEKDGASNKSVNGRLGYQISDNLSLDISGNYSKLSSDYDSFNADSNNTTDKKTLSGRAATTLKTFEGKWEHIVSLQGANTERDYSEPLSTDTRFTFYDGTQTTAEYQSNIKLRRRDFFTVGALTEKQDVKNSSTSNIGITTAGADKSFRTNSIYTQYLLGLTDTTTLTAGGRRDNHSAFGSYTTYRTTLAQEIPATGTILRGSYGTGFKAPSLFQLFDPTYGNATLRPEESKSYDIGFEQTLVAGRLKFGVTAFRNDFKDLIDYDFGTNSYRNFSQVHTKGTESTASFALTPELSFNTSHTFLLSEDAATHKTLNRRPKHSFGGGVDYAIPDQGNIGVDARYVSWQWDNASNTDRLKPYTVFGAHASYSITPQVALYTRVENLFDKNYQEVYNFNAAGFSAYLGIKANY